MKVRVIRVAGFAGFFVVFGFLLGIFFLNQIKTEISFYVANYGYFAVFIITLIVEILAQPIGPEIPLVTGRIFGLNIIYVSLLTSIGSILASLLNYKIGGLLYENVCEDRACRKYLKLHQRYGRYGLLIAALGPVPYVPFCWFSGAFGLGMRKFLYFGVIPRIFRIIIVAFAIALFF